VAYGVIFKILLFFLPPFQLMVCYITTFTVAEVIWRLWYRGADKSLARPISRCISFDASLVIYINSTNIPPIMNINRIYEHQIFCRCSLFPSWSG